MENDYIYFISTDNLGIEYVIRMDLDGSIIDYSTSVDSALSGSYRIKAYNSSLISISTNNNFAFFDATNLAGSEFCSGYIGTDNWYFEFLNETRIIMSSSNYEIILMDVLLCALPSPITFMPIWASGDG